MACVQACKNGSVAAALARQGPRGMRKVRFCLAQKVQPQEGKMGQRRDAEMTM